jgi:hypothetical protein
MASTIVQEWEKKTEGKKPDPRIEPALEPAQKHYHPKLPKSKPVFSKDKSTNDGWFQLSSFFPNRQNSMVITWARPPSSSEDWKSVESTPRPDLPSAAVEDE